MTSEITSFFSREDLRRTYLRTLNGMDVVPMIGHDEEMKTGEQKVGFRCLFDGPATCLGYWNEFGWSAAFAGTVEGLVNYYPLDRQAKKFMAETLRVVPIGVDLTVVATLFWQQWLTQDDDHKRARGIYTNQLFSSIISKPTGVDIFTELSAKSLGVIDKLAAQQKQGMFTFLKEGKKLKERMSKSSVFNNDETAEKIGEAFALRTVEGLLDILEALLFEDDITDEEQYAEAFTLAYNAVTNNITGLNPSYRITSIMQHALKRAAT
ncbi:MAG: hypothetical protein OXQ96_08225 [Alphaproteobacteria bacterium]|nr:hypothetical protein [Alphaproteobacteria bacterium]